MSEHAYDRQCRCASCVETRNRERYRDSRRVEAAMFEMQSSVRTVSVDAISEMVANNWPRCSCGHVCDHPGGK